MFRYIFLLLLNQEEIILFQKNRNIEKISLVKKREGYNNMKLLSPVKSGSFEDNIKGYLNFILFFLPLPFIITFLIFNYRNNQSLITARAGVAGKYLKPAVYNASSFATAPSICQISDDQSVFECKSSVELKVDEGVTNYVWSTGATTPSIIVTSSGQYWWEVANMEKNTVTNGNFTDGNSGFSSSYNYITLSGSTGPFGAVTADGYYTVAANPVQAHSLFSSFSDHTNGKGNMMVVNGAAVPNVTIWKQSISVEPHTTYIFSIWGASATPGNPGKLAFSINNQQVGDIQLSPTTGFWQNFTIHWTSGSSTVASIAIVNRNTASNGNDFALDDIVFAPVCRKNFNVKLDPRPSKPSTSYTIQ